MSKTKFEKRIDLFALVFGLIVLWLSVGVVSLNMLMHAQVAFWIVTGVILVGLEARFHLIRPAARRPIAGWIDASALVIALGWVVGACVALALGWGR